MVAIPARARPARELGLWTRPQSPHGDRRPHVQRRTIRRSRTPTRRWLSASRAIP